MAWAARVVVAGALPVFVLPALLQLAGLQVFSLTTGSMAPAHPAGSLVIAARPPTSAAVPVGAVVLIDIPGGMHVTHRVVALVRDDAGALVAYRTRGDAVAETDPLPVARASITGLVVGGVPILGSLRAWMESPLGIALGVVLVCAFTLLSTLLGDDRRRVEVALAGDAGRR